MNILDTTKIVSISDIIQIISIIISSVFTIISIGIAVLSLKKSQKAIELTETSIEEANRPYIVVYSDCIQVASTIHQYLIVKNFGKIGATITSLKITPPYKKDLSNGESGGFTKLDNTFLAPNQTLTTVLFSDYSKNKRVGVTNISITYKTSKKEYIDNFIINEDLDLTFTKTKPHKTKPITEVVTYAAEELIRKNL